MISLQFLFQLDSEGSRSGSSLSLRAVAPGGGGGGSVGGGAPSAPSPAHTGTAGGVGGHRGVQRSISATSSNKPRRGSTGGAQSEAQTSNNNNTTSVVQTGSAGPGAQGAPEPGQGLRSMIGPFHVCVFGFLSYSKVV